MCTFIYAALILTFAIYADAILGQYALSVTDADGGWSVIALGWELMLEIWPLLVLVAAVSSALTYLVLQRIR